jgi:hypothetical protein
MNGQSPGWASQPWEEPDQNDISRPSLLRHPLVRQPEIEIFTVVSLFVAGSGWFWLGAGGVVAKSTSAGDVRGC